MKWKKIWKWLNGRKTIISSIILLILNSDYIEGLFTGQDELYILVQTIAGIMFAGSMGHHVRKSIRKNK